PGYNLFVQTKDRKTGVLYDMMIYDMSQGFDNAMVILADSGYLAFTKDKTHIYLKLWQGESFENLRDASTASNLNNVPYRRESFSDKELMMPFDANFNRMDEQTMRNQYVGKDMAQLQATIDSVGAIVDSMNVNNVEEICYRPTMGIPYFKHVRKEGKDTVEKTRDVQLKTPLNVDSIFRRGAADYSLVQLNVAVSKAKRRSQEAEFKSVTISDQQRNIRRHAIELHKKFTLSFACIIFFFIGAPLGAIIRKGGLGVPVVISVILFIFYYIIDNTGYKMAREGRIEVWEGMWLSSAVLLPLGIFLTYKAVNDSAVFNPDAWKMFFTRLLGLRVKRTVQYKEVIINESDDALGAEMLVELDKMARDFLAHNPPHQGYLDYWLKGYNRQELKALSAHLENTVDYLSNTRNRRIVRMLTAYPVIRSLWDYHPTGYRSVGWAAIVCFPIGIPIWLRGRFSQHRLRHDIESIQPLSEKIIPLLTNNNKDN
ncbi:MAG: LptF/LptG family permease, partial [Muribaculaceae bacterium]|nr:LptF/LptG family permease [Muribaculaceae bacterium]